MEMPVKSKVEEINLRAHEFLLPIFEVVVNAIISVAEKHKNGGGLITITIEREKKVGSLFEATDMLDKEGKVISPQIKNFSITDNGLGFDDQNFKSFSTAYSERHKDKGCKGVGRFTVLACFNRMEILSVYKANEKQYLRQFEFDVEREIFPLDGNPKEASGTVNNLTTIKLLSYYNSFKQKSAVSSRSIAEEIIEHCLPFLIGTNPPTIILKDDLDDSEIILNDILKEVITFDGKPETFYPFKNGPEFKLMVVKKTDSRIHRLRLCANNRVVGRSENIASFISGFESPFKDAANSEYCIDAYVTSPFLDSKVNTIRNSFHIPAAQEDNMHVDEVTLNGIEKGVGAVLERKYASILEKIQESTLQRIKEYILNPKNPHLKYRALLNKPDLLRRLPNNLSDDKLDEQLHRIKYSLEKSLSKSLRHASKKGKVDNYEEYSKEIKNLLDQDAMFAKDKLADLVIQRKAILKVFKKLLRISKDGEYNLEEDIHNLIFPMGHTNDTLPYEYHNLWVLDERLAFHSFVASDKKLKSNPVVNNTSNKEPDILIFDFPWAFSGKDGMMNSMVIFEFKRPGRDMNTPNDKNLDSQIMLYYQELMESKAKDYKGEYINMEKTTPKFGYVICDLHKDLVTHNTDFNQFRQTPYKTLYKLNDAINLHIEAISYQQLVEMSEKRHLAFFKELGIEGL